MENIFKEITERVPFEVVVNYYGIEFNHNRKALCPFHDEKTPSFHNFSTHGYCFACGKIADVIDIEACYTGLTPFEAALSLAKRYGIQLPEFTPKDRERANKQAQAYKLLERLANYANKNIKQHPEVKEFFKNKGLDENDINRYLIGYVGDENPVTKNLKNESEVKLAEVIGLTNKYGDHFKSRIIIPIWNYGKIVYLTGRASPDSAINEYNPKYLHLKNSEVVYKQIAFSESLRKEKCVVVEGITDAIAFLKAGVPACASLGTNLGEHETESFLRAKTKLYFCFDNDDAGNTASYKLARKFQGYVVNLDSNKDCDELLAEKGIDEFKKIAEKAISEAKCFLDVVIENENTLEAIKEIAKLEYSTNREKWLKKLSKKSGIKLVTLEKDLKKIEKQLGLNSDPQSLTIKPQKVDLLEDSKPLLHPGMDLIDDQLIYGIKRGDNPLFICNKKVVDTLEISTKYIVSNEPKPNRFSSYGTKIYINGGEIRGPKLFNNIYNLLSDHIVFKATWQIVLIVIWIFGTYLHRCFPLFPYLWIQSPTKRCGKTRLLELLSELCFNSDGIQTAPTEAVLYRLPAITAGTLCWDEAENLYNNKEKGERLQILNAAYRKGAKIARCDGEKNEVRFFEVYRPISLTGISRLPDTISDRSIKIELIRKKKDEKVKRLQIERIQKELQSLRDGLHIFALERTPKIVEAYNQFEDKLIPKDIDDRLRDAIEILLSLAAGIYCYDTSEFQSILNELQNAVKALSSVRISEEDDTSFIRSIGILKEKLAKEDIKEIILSSKEAIQVFCDGGLDWVEELKHAQKILRRLGFYSDNHRINDQQKRGYKITLTKIEDLWQRYGDAISEKNA